MGLGYTSTRKKGAGSFFFHMTANKRTKLKVGVVGLGRLGKVYVRDLAARIPETTVVAVADIDRALAASIAEEFDIPSTVQLCRRFDRRPQRRCGGHRHLHACASRQRHRGGRGEEADVLRKTAGAQPCRMRGHVERGREVGRVLSNGLHAPLRPRLRRGEGKNRAGRHRQARRLQIELTRSVPPQPRIRESGQQRGHHGRHGDSRFRSRPMVHGRCRRDLGKRCGAGLPGDGVDRGHRQRHRDASSSPTAGWASSISRATGTTDTTSAPSCWATPAHCVSGTSAKRRS